MPPYLNPQAITARCSPFAYLNLARTKTPLVRTTLTINPTCSSTRSASSSSDSAYGSPVVDQTKKGNDPNQDKRDEHKEAGNKATDASGRDHPAKQPDPQKSPERSTGFETEGPGTKAGEGEDTGNVHKEEGFKKQMP
ncbi:hypothetical protein H2198_006207 [Neophaeococcomyces mojaviensis]|uniref:Uncharacterized protein n=1 Tax=Neophaeococcomyces mojaviensis TaxID=3383035 RepID=A0ACC3A3J6_9EURO|nr:hypothetical protein H2198_006207 [Knufia sp. JES_112]